MKRVQRIGKTRARTPEAQEQSSALPSAPLHHVASPYLTLDELVQYLKLRSRGHAYTWLSRNPVRKFRGNGLSLRVLRVDVDAAVQRTYERRRLRVVMKPRPESDEPAPHSSTVKLMS